MIPKKPDPDALDPVLRARADLAIRQALHLAGGDPVVALGYLAISSVIMQDNVSHGYMRARARFRPAK